MTLANCACNHETLIAYQEQIPKRPRYKHALCPECGFSWGIREVNHDPV